VLLIFLVFCNVLLYVITFLVQCCYIRNDLRIKTIFSSFPPVVCRNLRSCLSVFLCMFVNSDVEHFDLSYVFMFRVPCSDVRYDFRIKTKLGSSSPPVGCRGAHLLFTLFVFA